MKKSSFFLILGIASLLFVTTAASVKLKQEYSKGNYANPIVKKALPSFSYIKENRPESEEVNYIYTITIMQSDSNYVAVDSTEEQALNFTVKNDTLFITKNEALTEKQTSYNFKAKLAVRNMHYLSAMKSYFKLTNWKSDSLLVTAEDYGHVTFFHLRVNTLNAIAKDHAQLELTADVDSIPSLHLALQGNSKLIADNVAVKERTFKLNNNANLDLRGRSISTFGVK